ncbi:MAG: tetratricopeptide repeat protein [Candidatus Omnitrophica bacterium]|nr:tetratricopeptide repeat protein [Candidatus Omnitrophota bacterium]
MFILRRNLQKVSIFAHPFFLSEIIFAAVLLVFSPCLQANLSNWDDQVHIYLNPQVEHLSVAGVGRMFQERINGIYIPLTTLSFAVEKYFFGYDPGLIHLDNMLLHALVAVLLMLLGGALGLTNRAAFLGALLFALHPIHVESVAWATERKDVLYSVFYLVSLLCWWRWLGARQGRDLFLAFLAAAAALLAKPMAVSLPLTMALLAWFHPARRMMSWVMVALCGLLASGIGSVTYSACVRNPVADPAQAPLILVWTAVFPLWKFFLPAVLHPLYDLPEPVSFWNWPYLSAFLLAAVLALALWKNRRDRLLLLAAGWYFVSTFFLYRFDAVDTHIVADRFMYLPSAGLCLWLGNRFVRWLDGRTRKLAVTLILAIFLFLSLKTFAQCQIWLNGNTLWSYVIDHHPRRAFAYNNRAGIYVAEGRYDLAVRDITQAILLKDDRPRVYYNRGVIFALWADALVREGRAPEARALYQRARTDLSEAVAAAPGFTRAYYYRGLAEYHLGQYREAGLDLDQAIRLFPNYEQAYHIRGKVRLAVQECSAAEADSRQAIRLDPVLAGAYNDLGAALACLGREQEAVEALGKALKLEPELTEAWLNRATLRERLGDRTGAARDRERGARLQSSGKRSDF